MVGVDWLVAMVFSGLAPLVVEDVADEGDRIRVKARTPDAPAACPRCGARTARVHGYHARTLADVPLDARRVLMDVRVRRLVCPTRGCLQTFREQVPGVVERYQRRTSRLAAQVGVVVRELAGRAGARVLSALAVVVSRHTALRCLLRLPVPARRVPRVLGVDDFALRRRHRYATVLIDAETRQRVDVLPDRTADTLEAWLRAHPGVEVVCRDGSGAYAEAVRRALPDAVQVGDRWHLWHNVSEAVGKEVAAHSGCWAAAGPPRRDGQRATTTRERWTQVHELLDKQVGLLECARRLNLSLNTVKRYARIPEPERLIRAPQYRPTLVDPYRDHLRQRREHDPALPVARLFEEIKDLGYTGSLNLLYRYITQGRVEADRQAISPRRLTRYLLTAPDQLKEHQREIIDTHTAACPEMTTLAGLIRSFAALLTPADGNAAQLTAWIAQARDADLPHLHACTRGFELDRDAVNAALTRAHHNGGTEGVNTKTKLIKRQMYGRAGFPLLRHRILLG
ncbi:MULTISPECIES: ISL3 family transposase [unclassified Pseudofrankia]|uniref:ISL3 family transposase n=1 Tax=unclassified Pseudofrankia TaxID=2994372 RepID=UPI0008DAC330|nr:MULTISPECIES: ISL3 family transposase [unclassified Pseudofrankia]MDT3446798.1 ISL3 family transposase [Pseudofrankia sp. BMG5.37]OHV57174.1 transposase [Pseudofrankia sp. BMG5.36]